ncbi:signal peptidase I [Candidatus Pacearchaeota archaeon]|nr:signal peptidase I [Candidatus Pacearchaeota archaeon]
MNKKIEGIKKFWKKFWFMLWKDDSLKGWIFSIIFLFVFIKFIFFPILGLVTGTALPLAIVESCSMHHAGTIFSNYNNWWERHEEKYEALNIIKKDFQGGLFNKFRRGFTKGDILLLIKAKPEKLKIGDIIAFNSGTRNIPVIHRIINIKEKDGELTFTTIGDNNAQSLTSSNNVFGVDERKIKSEQLVGKAVLRIVPYLGWGKLVFFEHLKPKSERGICKEN